MKEIGRIRKIENNFHNLDKLDKTNAQVNIENFVASTGCASLRALVGIVGSNRETNFYPIPLRMSWRQLT